MEVTEGIVIIFIGLILVGLPFAYAGHNRNLRHKETMALIEKGLMEAPKMKNGKDTLRWGIVFTSVGVALLLGLYPIGYTFGTDYLFRVGPWMLIGLLPTFFGLGLITVYKATEEEKEETNDKKKK